MRFYCQIVALLILLVITSSSTTHRDSHENSQVSIAFYNTHNLFDTIPSTNNQTKLSTNYSPKHYQLAISNIAKLLDDMNADVVGLCEVENENVLLDLINATKNDYCYIYRQTNDSRGANIALLYKNDILHPYAVEQLPIQHSRQILHISAELHLNDKKELLEILVCHMPSKLNGFLKQHQALKQLAHYTDSLQTTSYYDHLIVMGDMNTEPTSKIFKTTFGKPDKNGFLPSGLYLPQIATPTQTGTYAFGNKWSMIDMIMVDSKKDKNMNCYVFIKDYLFAKPLPVTNNTSPTRGTPLNHNNASGFSDHLPIILNYIP